MKSKANSEAINMHEKTTLVVTFEIMFSSQSMKADRQGDRFYPKDSIKHFRVSENIDIGVFWPPF